MLNAKLANKMEGGQPTVQVQSKHSTVLYSDWLTGPSFPDFTVDVGYPFESEPS